MVVLVPYDVVHSDGWVDHDDDVANEDDALVDHEVVVDIHDDVWGDIHASVNVDA